MRPLCGCALRCGLHARRIQLVRGNADRFAVGADLVGNVLRSELGRERLRVRRLQILKERLVIGRADEP